MKKILLLFILTLSYVELKAQEEIYFTDFYISTGYRNQPFTQLNERLDANGYRSFNSDVGFIGGGISYIHISGIGIFAETEMNLNRKSYGGEDVKYRYLPVHLTAGVQYHFLKSDMSEWRFYPKLGIFYGTTSLDFILIDPNRDFDENLMGAMNTSFIYQRNYGLNFSLNADKLIGAFFKPTTQVGIYSRVGLQVGYIFNAFSSRTKLRRNFKLDLKDDFSIRNSPEFDPSAFYIKLNVGLGKFKKNQ